MPLTVIRAAIYLVFIQSVFAGECDSIYENAKRGFECAEREIALGFECQTRVFNGVFGSEIIFAKENKKNRYRKDSTFRCSNGYWEVSETDKPAGTFKTKTSLGVKTVRLYDDKRRVTNSLVINKEGDTLMYNRYFWKDGRLVKTIFDGVERVFIYGKTLQDTVRVIPSDEGLLFHSGYDNSVGKIPDEDDPNYRFFVLGPYGYGGGYAGNKKEKKP